MAWRDTLGPNHLEMVASQLESHQPYSPTASAPPHRLSSLRCLLAKDLLNLQPNSANGQEKQTRTSPACHSTCPHASSWLEALVQALPCRPPA